MAASDMMASTVRLQVVQHVGILKLLPTVERSQGRLGLRHNHSSREDRPRAELHTREC